MLRSLTLAAIAIIVSAPLLAEEIDLLAGREDSRDQNISFELTEVNADTFTGSQLATVHDVSVDSGYGSCCDSCCQPCGCGSCCPKKLFGVVAPTDHSFDSFISPMTNPVFFEDPRTLSEARFIYLRQKVPAAALGGEVELFALHLRAALTDRLSFIATKDGYVMSSNPLVDDGWADVAAGLKYNLYKDVCRQEILSVGLTMDLPLGSTRTLQGNGDGEFHLFMTGGAQLGCNWHVLSATGLRLPSDSAVESQMWYWSNHIDRYLGGGFYALAEANWYHWMKSGKGGLNGVEGGDLFNLGSRGVAGNDIATGAFGLKYKPRCRDMEIGVAWEVPLTTREDLLDNRLTIDWIVRY